MIDLIIEPDSTRIKVKDNFATKILKIQTGKEQAMQFFKATIFRQIVDSKSNNVSQLGKTLRGLYSLIRQWYFTWKPPVVTLMTRRNMAVLHCCIYTSLPSWFPLCIFVYTELEIDSQQPRGCT